jgi:hypothetical protein
MANFDVQTKKRLDKRLAVSPEGKEFIIDVAGAQVTPRVEPATSLSNSTINFNITPNSPTSVLDRSVIVATKVKFVFTGSQVGGSGNVIQPEQSAPRGFNYGVQSSTVTINGLSISQETQAIMHVLSHFSEADHMIHKQTISPSWMAADYVQRYLDVSQGTNMNTLSNYKNSTRARFGKGTYDYTVNSISGTAANLDVTFYEYMTLSPMNYNGDEMPGLTNVTSLQLNFVLANLERMWAQANDNITTLQVTILESNCHFQELSFPVYLNVPPVVTTSYTDIQRQTSSRNQLIAAGASAVLSSNSYQLNTVPHSIIVYAKERDSDIYATASSKTNKTDAYGVITQLEIQYNNQSAILSSASQVQLFQMSARNGVDLSWQEFQGTTKELSGTANSAPTNIPLCGSLICLSFGKDISANDPTAIPGTSINSNFQVRATVKNPNNSGIDIYYDLTVLYIYEGILSVSSGQAFKYLSLLTRDQTLSLEVDEGDEISGGAVDFKGLLSKAKSGLKKAMPYLKPFVSTALDVGSQAATPYLSSAPQLRDTVKQVHGLGLKSMGAGMTAAGVSGGQLQSKSAMSLRAV